jgi:hypothetical protein
MSKSQKKRDAFNYRAAYFRKNPGLFGCIWFCSQCGIPLFGRDSVQVDHIIPLAGVGINRTINTVAICPKCNREKSDKGGKYIVKGAFAKIIEVALFTIQKFFLKLLVFILRILHAIITGILGILELFLSFFSSDKKIAIMIIAIILIIYFIIRR